MSYKPRYNTDSLSELFSNMNDCECMCKRALESDDLQDFVNWFDKAVNINKRYTTIYFRKNKEKLSTTQTVYAKRFIQLEI